MGRTCSTNGKNFHDFIPVLHSRLQEFYKKLSQTVPYLHFPSGIRKQRKNEEYKERKEIKEEKRPKRFSWFNM
jgi:hypothetical protein